MRIFFLLCLEAKLLTGNHKYLAIVFDAQAWLKNQQVALLVVLRGALAIWFLINFGTFFKIKILFFFILILQAT